MRQMEKLPSEGIGKPTSVAGEILSSLSISVQLETRQSEGQLLGRLSIKVQLTDGFILYVPVHVFANVREALWRGAAP